MNDDATTAYLFQCQSEGLFAVSHDATGRNIPRTSCTQGWALTQEFQLGVNDIVPAPIMPEPIMRGILNVGYYIWRDTSSPSAPAGAAGVPPAGKAGGG